MLYIYLPLNVGFRFNCVKLASAIYGIMEYNSVSATTLLFNGWRIVYILCKQKKYCSLLGKILSRLSIIFYSAILTFVNLYITSFVISWLIIGNFQKVLFLSQYSFLI